MNLVDSSGWLEYFTDGSNADFFATALIQDATRKEMEEKYGSDVI